jgi:hypothetical protein
MIWEQWLREDWNNPSRADYYIMRLTQIGFCKKGTDLNSLKIPFEFKPEEEHREPWQPRKMSKEEMEQRTRLFKQQMFKYTGYEPKPGEL